MAGPGRVVKKKRGGGRPRSVQAVGLVGDEPHLPPPATAEPAENTAVSTTANSARKPRSAVYTFKGSRAERKREQNLEYYRQDVELKRFEKRVKTLEKCIKDSSLVDTPLGQGYLVELEGEGLERQAVVRLIASIPTVAIGILQVTIANDTSDGDDDSDAGDAGGDGDDSDDSDAGDAGDAGGDGDDSNDGDAGDDGDDGVEARRRQAINSKRYRARVREASAAARANRERVAGSEDVPPSSSTRGLRCGQKRTHKMAVSFERESRNLGSPERASFLNSFITHKKVNRSRIQAGVRTLGETHLDTYIADNLADHVGNNDTMRRAKDATSMAVKHSLATLVTTTVTGKKRGGDGVSVRAIALRLKLGPGLIRQGQKLNVTVDADGTLAYKRMLAATRRGVRKIDRWVAKIATEHWLANLSENGKPRDVARWRTAPHTYLEHKIGLQASVR